jgi:hypothetical protein
MKWKDIKVNKEKRFAIGIEEESGKYYLSIPVSNRLVDYEEYFELAKQQFDDFLSNPASGATFAAECKSREPDDLLLQQPGTDRGIAS